MSNILERDTTHSEYLVNKLEFILHVEFKNAYNEARCPQLIYNKNWRIQKFYSKSAFYKVFDWLPTPLAFTNKVYPLH